MDKEYQSIDSRQTGVWLIGRLIFLLILAALAVLVTAIVNSAFDTTFDYGILETLINVAVWFLVALQAVNTFVMPPLQRRLWKYRVCDDKIEIWYGVIRKTTMAAPVARIQQVSLVRPLIDRIFGLSRLTVTTAGSSLVILGLPKDVAQPMLETLNERVNVLAKQPEEVSDL